MIKSKVRRRVKKTNVAISSKRQYLHKRLSQNAWYISRIPLEYLGIVGSMILSFIAVSLSLVSTIISANANRIAQDSNSILLESIYLQELQTRASLEILNWSNTFELRQLDGTANCIIRMTIFNWGGASEKVTYYGANIRYLGEEIPLYFDDENPVLLAKNENFHVSLSATNATDDFEIPNILHVPFEIPSRNAIDLSVDLTMLMDPQQTSQYDSNFNKNMKSELESDGYHPVEISAELISLSQNNYYSPWIYCMSVK